MPIDLLRPRRAFSLPEFELAPLDFAAEDELVLDDVVASIGPEPERSALAAVPTPGELRQSIERHLRAVELPKPAADATDELRDALAQLRRSIA